MLGFTSGTTGYPKGVKMTHKMIVNVCAGLQLGLAEPFGANDTYISYLPYAHIFEQVLYALALLYGMRIGYYSGDI
jgi:long-chain acyl-CoA synthetase